MISSRGGYAVLETYHSAIDVRPTGRSRDRKLCYFHRLAWISLSVTTRTNAPALNAIALKRDTTKKCALQVFQDIQSFLTASDHARLPGELQS